MTPDDIAQRLDNRAGYQLVTYREVGLPIFGILATALILERQDRSCIDEFVLRSIAAGLQLPTQIQGILGIPPRVVDTTIADLIRQEAIRRAPSTELMSLTERGKQMVGDAAQFCPSEQTIWFPFDGLLRKPKWYGNMQFMEPSEARDRGMPQLRAVPARAPEVNELSTPEVSEVVRLAASVSQGDRQVLRMLTIERRSRKFLPAVALVYRAIQSDEVHIGFAIDGRISQEHELAFLRAGGLDRQPIFDGLRDAADFGPIDGILSGRVAQFVREADAERRKAAPIADARAELSKAAIAVVSSQSEREKSDAAAVERRARELLTSVEKAVGSKPVRPLPVYEHPAVLEEAISKASKRLLVVSPWIRRAVVDRNFLRSIRQACGRGVKVSIGYGLGSDDISEKAWDEEARQELEGLAKELALLQVCRLGDTHAKVLIKDSEYFVITSFNWLSFRGDQSRPFREEWGTMVRDSALVDELYGEIITRFGEKADVNKGGLNKLR